MPAPADFATLETTALGRLQAPISAYFDATDKAAADSPRGRIATTQARLRFLMELGQLHTNAATLAVGGSLTREERGLLSDIINQDRDYANGFIDALPTLSREQAMARCAAYVATIRSTYNEFLAIDLPTLPMYPQDARLRCGRWCKCTMKVVRLGGRDFDVYWIMDPSAEHCDDCISLATPWQPLQIRSGEIMQARKMTDVDLRRVKALLRIALQERVA